MPSIRTTVAVPPARTLVVRSAGAVPARGTVPSTGVPSAIVPVGRVAFESHILVAGFVPTIDRGGFPARFASELNTVSMQKASSSAADVGIAAVASTDSSEIRSITTARATDSFGVLGAPFRDNVPATWVTVSGFANVSQEIQLQALNRAIAWSLANSVSNPPEGTSGLASRIITAFNVNGACEGTRRYAETIVAACTRWTRVAAAQPAAVQPPAPTPGAATQPPAPQGTLTPIAQSASEPALCSFVTASRFWLRPSPTFERVGPEIPAGTRVDLMDATSQTQGTLRLYDVRVAATQTVAAARAYVGRRGWAAMSAADVASCASVIAARDAARRTGGTVPKPVGTPGASTGGGNTAIVPVAPATPAMRPESTTRPGQVVTTTPVVPPPAPAASSSKTPYIVGGALVLTAGVMYWQRDAIRKMFK
jgi:hypothetical protein